MIGLLLKVSITLLLLYVSIFVVRHLKALNGISHYKKQGVTIHPGATRFILGNLVDIANVIKSRSKA